MFALDCSFSYEDHYFDLHMGNPQIYIEILTPKVMALKDEL